MINSDDALLGFTTGNAAMLIGGTWTISSIDQNNPDLNYGAFAIPAEDGTAGLVGTAANGFSINANTQNKRGSRRHLLPTVQAKKDRPHGFRLSAAYLPLRKSNPHIR